MEVQQNSLCIFVTLAVISTFIHCVNTQRSYRINADVKLGRRFDGIGAISGGGATSKLLVNYPEPQRTQILDYLFKKDVGAALHILKVEIGGDSQSSEGTESSHMHEEWDENYHRGYEWWLMKEAKKRNPSIKLYGLPWGWPSWISRGDTWWPYKYPKRTADYISRWIEGAKKEHGLVIDYIGIWNEKPYDINYIKVLRETLDARGLKSVRIVAADLIGTDSWDIAKDIIADKTLDKAVDIVGGHYTGTWTTELARNLSQPLWSSEDYSTANDEGGGGCMARLLNQNYIKGLMTSTIAWNLIYSYYSDLPYAKAGLMTAQEPWSGHYTINPPIWTTAHTSQFTAPGWTYLAHGAGVGMLGRGGSYVTIISPNHTDVTVIIETMQPTASLFCLRPPQSEYKVISQNISLVLEGHLTGIKSLHLWSTTLGLGKIPSHYFKYQGTVQVVKNVVTLHAEVNSVYTLTTVTHGNHKPGYSPSDKVNTNNKSRPFPLPYKDNFEGYAPNGEAYNFAQQVGVFEITESGDKTHGRVMQQVMIHPPIFWCPLPQVYPFSVIGNHNWSDVAVTVDVYVPRRQSNGTSGVFIAARIDQGGCVTYFSKGVFFFLHYDSQQIQLSQDLALTQSISTQSQKLLTDTWYTLSLHVKGLQVVSYIDGKPVFNTTLKDLLSPHGFAGLGTKNFGIAQFDNFHVGPT